MAAPLNLELGLSSSAAAAQRLASQLGQTTVNVSAGGEKQTQTLYIVAGVVAVAIVILLLFRRRR